MTPTSPKPSMHNVMTGYFVPNASDEQAGQASNFGSTIIIADSTLCGSNIVTPGATARGDKFTEFMSDLGLSESSETGCSEMWTDFSWTGSSNKILYFARDWSSDKCKPVNWATEYSAFVRDGYKKCVCKEF